MFRVHVCVCMWPVCVCVLSCKPLSCLRVVCSLCCEHAQEGDAVVHQSDLLHGVDVVQGSRWSYILWYKVGGLPQEHGRGGGGRVHVCV